MPRPDGRIEKGQSLNRAISARAWNRAQDAADVVLGVRPGFEAGQGQPGRIDYITIQVDKQQTDNITDLWPSHIVASPQGHKLNVGYAMAIDAEGTKFRNASVRKDGMNELAAFSVENLFATNDFEFPYNRDQFGIITGVAVVPAVEATQTPAKYSVTMAIGGIFVCRCLAFAQGRYLVGPASIPTTTAVRPLWYPYPVTAPAGVAQVLGYGNYYRLTANEWPRVYEVLVKM